MPTPEDRALKFIRQGKIHEAISEYEKLLRRFPKDLNLMKKLAALYEQAGRKQDAINILLKLGHYFDSEGFKKQAIAIYKKLYQLNPAEINYAAKLADLYREIGFTVDAKNLYLKIAEFLSKKKRYNEALEFYRKLSEIDQNNIKIKELLVNLYLNQGKKEEGVKVLLEIADLLFKQNRTEEALNYLKRAVTLRPDDSQALLMAKEFSERTGQPFFEKLAKSLLKLSSNPVVKRLLADYYYTQNRLEEALPLYQELYEQNQNDGELREKLANLLIMKGDYNQAFKLLEPVVDSLISQKDYDGAIKILNQILKANNSFEPALVKLAQIYEQSGKKNNLIAALTTLLEIYDARNEKAKMKSVLQKLLVMAPENFDFQERYARLLEEEGAVERDVFIKEHLEEAEAYMKYQLWEKAEAEIEKILEKYPDCIDAKFKLLEIYVEKGNLQKAKEFADKLRLEIWGNSDYLKKLDTVLESLMAEKEAEKDLIEDEDVIEIESELITPEVEEHNAETMFNFEDSEQVEKEIEAEVDRYFESESAESGEGQELSWNGEVEIEEVEDFNPPEFPEELDVEPQVQDFSPQEEAPADRGGEKEKEVFDLSEVISQELEAIEGLSEESGEEDREEQMIKEFREKVMTAISEEDYETHFNLGIAYMEMGMLDDAIAEFQIVARSKERRLEAYELLGKCLFEKGLFEEALSTLNRGLQEKGYPPEKYLGIMYMLATIYDKLGNQSRAQQYIDRIKEIDPDYLTNARRLENLQ